MPHSLNYAEKYTGEVLETIEQGLLTAPFFTTNVDWLDAKTFHFTQMSVSGYKNHSRTGGWNSGVISQIDVPFTVAHDRDIQFLVDKADTDETARTAAIEKVSMTFAEQEQVPEIDCYTFSTIAQKAVEAANGLVNATALADYTKDNVYSKIVAMMAKGKLKLYRQRGSLVGYVHSDIMSLLEVSTEIKLNVQADTIVEGGKAIETRVVKINGVPLFEVVDTDRFKTLYDYTDGCVADEDALDINVLFGSVETVKTVPKISSIYYFSAGTHTEGDGDLYQNRSLMDTFVFPNGKDNKIDSIFVDLSGVAAYSASATYAVGDIVTQGGEVYVCKTAITVGETFTVAKWTKIS